jgi:hypothetical protein
MSHPMSYAYVPPSVSRSRELDPRSLASRSDRKSAINKSFTTLHVADASSSSSSISSFCFCDVTVCTLSSSFPPSKALRPSSSSYSSIGHHHEPSICHTESLCPRRCLGKQESYVDTQQAISSDENPVVVIVIVIVIGRGTCQGGSRG